MGEDFDPQGLEMPAMLRAMQDEMQTDLAIVRNNGTHFVVDCPTAEIARALLAIDESILDGETIRIQKAEYSMTGDEIFSFVDRMLMEESELRGLQQTCGFASRPNKKPENPAVQFRAVSAPEQKSFSSVKGGSGGRGKK